jgi:c-di-GMP-binding flagellar brake protein YcgR
MGSINIETVSSRDISVTGIALVSENDYKVGENYLLKLYLNWPQEGSPPFYACAKIMRTLPWRDSGKSIIGLCYFGMTKDMNEFIAKYVLEEQRRQLKQRRLIKD